MRVFGHRLFPIAVLALLGIGAYWNSLHAPFVFDDIDSVERNPIVRFATQSYRHSPRSLLFLTFAFNNWLNGQNPFGYHIVNLVLHILNGLIVFAIARRIYNASNSQPSPGASRPLVAAKAYALIAAAFFLVHPIQTESVTYISSRSELLSTMTYLCGLLSFMLIPVQKIGFFSSLLMLFFLGLGFGFKETVVTLPAGILLYDYIFVAKANIRALLLRWRFYLSFVVIGAAGSYWLLRGDLGLIQGFGGPLEAWRYFLTQFRVILTYIRILVFPSGLNLDYDFRLSASLLEPSTLLAVVAILGLLFVGWRWRSTQQLYSFSVFWFLLTLSPTSSIIPIPDVIFEHRVYLPLAGVCLSFPFVMEWIVKIWQEGIRRKWVITSASAVLAVFVVATLLRNEVWRDEVRLWSDIVRKSPHKLRPYGALINAYMKRGQEREAISIAKLGSENVPESRTSFLNTTGNLYLRLGEPQEAVAYFKSDVEEAVRTGMTSRYIAVALNNLAVAYMALAKTFEERAGQISDEESAAHRAEAFGNARDSLRKSLEANPANVEVLDSLVNVTRYLGEARMLEQESRKKLEANQREFQSLYSLAALMSLEERYVDSLNYFQRAEEVRPGSQILLFNHAFALSKIGEVDRAIDKYTQALRIDPIFDEAHYNIALLYVGKNDYDSA